MRILMVVVSDLSSDARVRREATALATAGHQVEVIGFDYAVQRPTRRKVNGVEYRMLPFPPRGSSRIRRLVGIGVFALRAATALLATPADAYHTHNLHIAVPCVLAARLRGARLVYDAHELVVPMMRHGLRGLTLWYEGVIWGQADVVITTNDSRARFLDRLHGGPLPLVVGNFPTEPSAIEPVDLHRSLGVPIGRRILIYQGGLYIADRCFDAVATALRELPDWHWVLVGFGSPRNIERLHMVVQAAGLVDRVHVLPQAPLDQLLNITAGADLGVVPLRRVHLNNYLGDTNKLFEYLMAGIPAVGSDFPQVRRALLDNPEGAVGAVFDPDDPATIASAIKELDGELAELKHRAWQVARRHYSWAQESAKLLCAYEKPAEITAGGRRSSEATD